MLICIAHLSVVHYCHDYSSDAHANMSALFLTVCAHGWFYQIDLIIILESESNYPLGGVWPNWVEILMISAFAKLSSSWQVHYQSNWELRLV